MAIIEIEIDHQAISARLTELVDRLTDATPVMKRIGMRLRETTSDAFKAETAPDGAPWTPLAASTVKRRVRRGRSALAILRDSGKLAGSIRYEAGPNEVRVGTPGPPGIPYAAIHQFGGTIAMPARDGTVYLGRHLKGQAGRRFAKKKNKTTEARAVKIGAYSITIPARPYLGLGINDAAGILEDIEDYLSR